MAPFDIKQAHPTVQASSSRQSAGHRRLGSVWKVAVSATKGIFGPQHAVDDPTHHGDSEGTFHAQGQQPFNTVKKSSSSPSLNSRRVGSHNRQDDVALPSRPPPPPPSSTHSRRPRTAIGGDRPVISNPSRPRHLNNIESPPHPKLSYPLIQSGLPFPEESLPGVQYSSDAASSDQSLPSPISLVEPRSFAGGMVPSPENTRRRTKSAPGLKLPKRPHMTATSCRVAIETTGDSQYFYNALSPASTDSFPSPPLETPKMPTHSEYISTFTSPSQSSPRSIASSIRRKPVPRRLYTDPGRKERAFFMQPTPSTHSFNTVEAQDLLETYPPQPRTPLLSAAESIVNAHTQRESRWQDFKLSSTGAVQSQSRSASSGPGQARSAVYRSDDREPVTPDFRNCSAVTSTPPYQTAYRESSNVITAFPLDAGRLNNRLDEERPPSVSSACSGSSRRHGLSPLTDDEVRALRTFLRHHEGGNDARQRRQQARKSRSRQPSDSYFLHTAIVDSYLESDVHNCGSSDDADSHVWPSTSSSGADVDEYDASEAGDSTSTPLDRDAEAVEECNPLPLRNANRATFGYYGAHRQTAVPEENEGTSSHPFAASQPSLGEPRSWRHAGGDFGSMEDVMKSLHKVEESQPISPQKDRSRRNGFHTRDENPVVHIMSRDRQSPSLLHRPSSDFAVFDEDGRPNRRHSRVPSSVLGDPAEFACDERSHPSSSPEIGMAILSREAIARFESGLQERHLVSTFSSSSESDHFVDEDEMQESELYGSPSTVPCKPMLPYSDGPSTPSPDFELGDVSTSFDRLQSSLSKLRATHSPSRSRGGSASSALGLGLRSSGSGPMKSPLKPALRITPGAASSSFSSSSPSPPTPCSTLPPPSPSFLSRPYDLMLTPSSSGGSSVQPVTPASAYYHTSSSSSSSSKQPQAGYVGTTPPVPSFMHLTPNEPSPAVSKQRSRVRLRSLFSRSGSKKPEM